MTFGQILYSTTRFLTWMMKKGNEKKMIEEEEEGLEDIDEEGVRMKVKQMKMMMRGKRERKMKEKMTNEH
ncbi:hypothetical protein QTO34_017016 [Cnephaeus nilssonii]|uniref:Uncharacterized protein n=1 Tax=Cnephaeus nilssonii TaxID=3371016 RepID=A0AA40HAU9_CNENI|nr:hypothetical protein QTO34_017016 [Eptesicus nilssonii]